MTVLLVWQIRNKRSIFDTESDEVHGLVWEWDNLQFETSLKPLCPRCLAELSVYSEHQCQYDCVSCSFGKKIKFQHHVFKKVVQIEIEKRKRTGDYRKAQKRIAAIRKTFR